MGKTLKKSNKGITLIALVITIIVLLILAGVSISMLTGQNGILNRAGEAKEITETTQTEEQVKLAVMEALTQGIGELTDENLKQALGKHFGTKYQISGDEETGWILTVNGTNFEIASTGEITELVGIELATSLSVTPTTLTVAEGGTGEVTATQAGGGNEEIIWSVAEADKSKVTVVKKNANTATVTGEQAGTATITATTKNSGKTADCTVTITAPRFSDYSWSEINALAKEIAKDNTINNTTSSVTKTIGGKNYTAAVGDEKTITIKSTAYTVRILGFNHDTLANGREAYGDTSITKAGISFEFKTILFSFGLFKDGSSAYDNDGGWSNRLLRSWLNTDSPASGSYVFLYDIETAMENRGIIKSVTKSYIDQKGTSYGSSSTVETCNDKLWLLSCSEIWSAEYLTSVGNAATGEGSRYKYYASKEGLGREYLKKCNAGGASGEPWWLRSPILRDGKGFCVIDPAGGSGTSTGNNSCGVAPGFAI